VLVRRADLELLVRASELHGQHPAAVRRDWDDGVMDVLCSGYGLVESPRWREGRLWFSDWTGGQIVAVDDSGATEVILEHRSLPMCFDFLPDHAYVNSGNFDFATGPPPGDVQPGVVGVVRAGVAPRVVAEDIAFPNGMVVTADGSTWSTPPARPGTPTSRTSGASGSRRAAKCRRPSCWTEARLHARRHGRAVPLCRHGRLARGRPG
jgi:hypothetical protein